MSKSDDSLEIQKSGIGRNTVPLGIELFWGTGTTSQQLHPTIPILLSLASESKIPLFSSNEGNAYALLLIFENDQNLLLLC